eukprot:TRINITY_DN27321_c0_g1_i2.p1 TRINITY_DN27321_c0_g1~~TRINITY_DN27321_c0_g1_i2.p1  ORF type:complete len:302 (-),score=19.25 TRINITY_DN27321_c0_g1_i2:461-1321(-)
MDAAGLSEATAAPEDVGPGLWLGDESWAKGDCLSARGITHRLQCNMREAEAQRWMATAWSCDCPLCPAGGCASLDLDMTTPEGEGQHQEETLPSPPPPPAPHPAPRRRQAGLSILAGSGSPDGNGVIHAYLPLFDDLVFGRDHASDLLREGAGFIHTALDVEAGRVYVHCEKGCSRSPAVVVQYLVEYRGFSLEEAAALLKSRRCRASPNGGFIDALVTNSIAQRDGGRPAAGQADGGGAGAGAQDVDNAEAAKAKSEEILAIFKRSWLEDFRAGRIKPKPVDRIL